METIIAYSFSERIKYWSSDTLGHMIFFCFLVFLVRLFPFFHFFHFFERKQFWQEFVKEDILKFNALVWVLLLIKAVRRLEY